MQSMSDMPATRAVPDVPVRPPQLLSSSAKARLPGERKPFHYKLFKTPKETVQAILAGAVKKTLNPIDVVFLLAVISGFYIGFGGMFAISVSAGLPNSDLGTVRLLNGICFSFALVFIIITGGELFTGNTMYMMMGVYQRRISPASLAISWATSFFGNWIGCVLSAYFFGYLTDLFAPGTPYNTAVKAIAYTKVEVIGTGQLFLRSIAANWLVCIAIFVGVCAEDIASKIIGCMLPIIAFAASGFEHIIANLFFCSLSIMYGADTTYWRFIYRNVLIVLLGNIIGGGLFAGFSLWWSYRFSIREDQKRPAKYVYFSWSMRNDNDDAAI